MSEPIKKNVVNLEDYGKVRRSIGSGPGSKALRVIRDQAATSLDKHIETLMDSVDDALFSRAEKAESNMVQTQYFDAMREMRIIRKDIENDFATNFKSSFDRGIPRSSSEADLANLSFDGDSDIGLVDTNDLEEELAVSNMINKIRSHCLQSLYALDKRIGFLIGDADLERFENPIGPEAICHAFREAANRIETGLEIRLVIFKLFDKHIGAHIDALYREINQQLIKMNVLPEIRTTVRKSANRVRYPGQEGQPGTPSPDGETAGIPGDNFPGNIPGQPVMGGIQSQGYAQYVQPSINALTYLQQGGISANDADYAENSPALDPTLVQTGSINILRNIRDTGVIQNLGKSGGMTLDIVAMLFDYILEDRNIPDAMRALIGRLQIPLLKVALLDNQFFSRKSHPARQLLNRLASTAVGWDESQGAEDPLYLRVESIVQTILDEFDDDINLFERLLANLDDFLNQEEEQAEILAERSAKVMEGKERLAAAESSTMEEIQPRIGKELNLDFVREFVATHWKNLLFICCARNGKDSEEWKQAVQTMDDLIWSVKPKTSPADRQRLVAIQPGLLEKLRHGMERLSIPPTERDSFIASLVRAHGRTAVNAEETGEPDARPVKPEAEPVQTPTPTETPKAIDDAFTARARQLKSGTWMEFRSHDGEHFRAKLSWVSPITGTCLFTDRKGLKTGNYTIEELAHLLRSARARLLNAAPLMDRAVRTALEEYGKK
ncbi:Thymidine phosphorylase [hydrothermal vent metagenome]|uniref:Thymidine phosphorylase n=1 Tax=hydrothermal vent metagenome TaxID=652676 RepID=A0A3B0YH21_9ZZZZ